jgi:predicted phage terminase large subunit-like protein
MVSWQIKGFDFSKRPTPRSQKQTPTKATLEGFQSFVKKANPRFVWYRHCVWLANVLITVANGERHRVMVFMPPRHTKSELVSRLFSAYYLSLFPDRWVGLNSYAAELAYTLSRSARENFQRNGGVVKNDAAAVKHWETSEGGGLWAAGVGGPITGKGFHLGLIDDPLKNAKEAASEVVRKAHKEWYGSTFYTREEPNASIVIIQTRWHQDDLSGWLLSEESEDEEPERWHIVSYSAVKESEQPEIPTTCTIEEDPREVGDVLCPERYPLPKLNKIAARIGSYFWNALFKQQPTAKEGSTFKVGELGIVDTPPAGLKLCRAWDFGATEDSGDYTAGVMMGKSPDGFWYVTDVVRGQWGAETVIKNLKQTATLDPRSASIRIPQDPGQAGKAQVGQLTRLLAGHNVKSEPISGDKETRAFGFSAQVNAGNVRLVKGAWNKSFIEELRAFPQGTFDDQVDASADAFNELSDGNKGVTWKEFRLR